MAAPDLPTLVPTSYSSTTGTAYTTTTVGNVDNTVASADGAFIVAGANSTASIFYAFTDTPSDFVKVKTLNYNIRYKIETLAGDTEVLYFRVWDSAKTTAYTNEATVVSTTANIAITNKGSTALTITAAGLAATKANWDAAFIEIRTAHTALHGNDGSVWSIDEFELTGTYDAPPTTVLGNPADAATGQSVTPTLNFTGTDANGDAVEYQVQVDTVNTFDSTSAVMDSYSESNYGSEQILYSGSFFEIAQSFVTSGGGSLRACRFYVRKTGSPTGNVFALLYAHSGTFGSSSLPNGTPLATSDAKDVSTLGTSLGIVEFTFSGAEQYELADGTNYCIALQFNSGDASNNVRVGLDVSSPTHGGNFSRYDSSWTAFAYDTIFYVYIPTPLLNKLSSVPDAGFTAGHPFTSGVEKAYTVQAGDALDASTVHYWRVRATDPSGSNTWGAWSSTRSFTTEAASGDQNFAPTTATATGTAYTPTTTGSGAATFAPAVATATGTAYNPTITGSGSVTFAPATATATGTAYDATTAATGAAPFAPATATATGTAYDPTTTGSGTATFSPDVATATGTAHDPTITGSGSVSFAPDTATATGTAYDASITATGAAPFAPDVATATGTAYDPTITGSGSVTFAPDAATATGTAYDPTIALGAQNFAPDTATATGTAYDGSITATGSATFAPATATASGAGYDVTITGTGAATFAPATATATGASYDVTITGSGSATFAPTTATSTGTAYDVTLTGSGAATLTPTTATATGTAYNPTITGTGAATFAPDTATATGTAYDPTITGSGSVAFAPDTATATAASYTVTITATGAATFAPATATSTGTAYDPTITGSGSVTFAPDTATATGTAYDGTLTLGGQPLLPTVAIATGTAYGITLTGTGAATFSPTTATASGAAYDVTITGEPDAVTRLRGGGKGPRQRTFTVSTANANADDEEIIIAVATAFVLMDK